MKITELTANNLLYEGATDVLYHYTNKLAALNILRSGEFNLSSSIGSYSERYFEPKGGYVYYMSTTRSKLGSYHADKWHGVMFVLDGAWFGRRFIVKPVDYFLRNRDRESEDRVFSKYPTIPIDGVKAIHILLRKDGFKQPEIREILILAKQRGLPAYLYDNTKTWRLQDTMKSITVGQAGKWLIGKEQNNSVLRKRKIFAKWFELIYKNRTLGLSDEAKQTVYNMIYKSQLYYDDFIDLEADVGNNRKPNSAGYDDAVKIIKYMQDNNLTSLVDLATFLKDKWSNIYDDENTKGIAKI